MIIVNYLDCCLGTPISITVNEMIAIKMFNHNPNIAPKLILTIAAPIPYSVPERAIPKAPPSEDAIL